MSIKILVDSLESEWEERIMPATCSCGCTFYVDTEALDLDDDVVVLTCPACEKESELDVVLKDKK